MDNWLMPKHIQADMKHWNHVTKSGASKLTTVPLRRDLLTNTVIIDMTLEKK